MTAHDCTTKKEPTMHEVLAKAMQDPAFDSERLRTMANIYESQQLHDAKRAYFSAKNAVQKEVAWISADAMNPQTKSRYASYKKLDEVLRPHYTAHGFSISYDTEDSHLENHVRVVAELAHEGGYSETFHVDMPVVTVGLQGNTNMTLTHATASAQTYGMRYLLKMIWNVAVGEDDDDGNAAGQKAVPPITEEQINEIEELVVEWLNLKTGKPGTKGSSKKARAELHDRLALWCRENMGTDRVEEFNQNGYEAVKASLERKIKRAKSDDGS